MPSRFSTPTEPFSNIFLSKFSLAFTLADFAFAHYFGALTAYNVNDPAHVAGF